MKPIPKPPIKVPEPPGLVIPEPPKIKAPGPPIFFTDDNKDKGEKDVIANNIRIFDPYGTRSMAFPKAEDLEELVIGACLIDINAIKEVEDFLKPQFFYNWSNYRIYQVIYDMSRQKMPIDISTVSFNLKRRNELKNCGGNHRLIGLSQQIGSSAHIEYHGRIIVQQYILRRIAIESNKVGLLSLKSDVDSIKLFEFIQKRINDLEAMAFKGINLIEMSLSPKEDLQMKMRNKELGLDPGIRIGVSEFDEWSGGIFPRDLVTIASRPGTGKTTLVISATYRISIIDKKRCSFFSLEMSKPDLYNRYAARITGVSYGKIRKALLSSKEYLDIISVYEMLDNSLLNVIDTSQHKNLFSKLEKMIRDEVKNGSEIVFIDYVQLIKFSVQSKFSDRTGELSVITRSLKGLANELNIPIVELAQLNRAADTRINNIPRLSDLKQSGSIEEDSDSVIFLVRDAASITEREYQSQPYSIIGDTQMIVAKGRHDGIRSFRTFLDFNNYDFKSYSDMDFP